MRRIPSGLLERMAAQLAPADRDEMAIPSYLHQNPALRWMAWRRLEVIARHLDRAGMEMSEDESLTVLDFGCGTGVLFDQALRYADRVYGVDLELAPALLLIQEWNLERVTLLTPDQVTSRVSESSVDVVVAAEVLEHIDRLADVMELFRSRLRSGGRLLTSLPTENFLYRLGRRMAGFSGDYHHHHAASIDAEILRAGFHRERIEKVPAPGPFAIYWVADYRAP